MLALCVNPNHGGAVMAKGKYAQRRARRKTRGVPDQGQARRYLRVRESLPSRDPKPQSYLPRPEESWIWDDWPRTLASVVAIIVGTVLLVYAIVRVTH